MSNRFNRPDMLKANRQRINKMRASRAGLIEARRFIAAQEEARNIPAARKIYAQHYHRDTRPWHERFVEWVTGC